MKKDAFLSRRDTEKHQLQLRDWEGQGKNEEKQSWNNIHEPDSKKISMVGIEPTILSVLNSRPDH